MQFDQDYRQDPAISQSDINLFERDIITYYNNKILGLGEDEQSDPMDIGSLIDAILLDPDELKRYYVVTDLKAKGKVKDVVDEVWKLCCNSPSQHEGENSSLELNDYKDHIIKAISIHEYQANWKLETRIEKIKSEGSAYFEQLQEAKGMHMVSLESWNIAHSVVEDIKTDPYASDIVKWLKGEDVPDHIEIKKKLKLKGEFEGVEMKGELDFVVINTQNKEIIPWDLKSPKSHANFRMSYRSKKYGRQGSYYSELLRQNYSGYKIQPFTFLVVPVARNNNMPLEAKYELPEVYEMMPAELFIHSEGYTFDSGYVEKGWKSLLREIKWHTTTGKWQHRQDYYTKGRHYLDSKINVDEALLQQESKELF